MSRTWTRREKNVPAPVTEERVRRQIGQAAGTEFFQNRDPLYHVTESFQMTFDAMGQRHARQAAGEREALRKEGVAGEQPLSQNDLPDATSSRSFYERHTGEDQDMLRRFSETAFQRGNLSAAVLQGSGQMMLFSCLKKTIGQSQPDKWQQRKLFEKVSPHRNSPGQVPNKIVFNRGFTDSAVGLVVDTLRDARRTVEDMELLATGRSKSEMGTVGGAQTLQKMYPFLDSTQEHRLLEEYKAELEGMDEADPRRSILHNAMGRTNALIAKKAQMKLEFINKLRFVADRATEALAVFQQPDYPGELYAALCRELDIPPEDDGGEDDGTAADPAGDAQGAAAGN